jgi:hypothetical protein
MTDPQTLALINRLERAHRCWKRLALGALAALLLVLFVGSAIFVFHRQQIRAEQQRAEQAIREADEHKQQVQRMLYYSQIALAERMHSQQQEHKPWWYAACTTTRVVVPRIARWVWSQLTAVERLKSQIVSDPSLLEKDDRARLRDADRNLEGTYLVRLFAAFEAALRSYDRARHNDPTRDVVAAVLIDSISGRRGQGISTTVRNGAHAVRELRNYWAHENEVMPDPMTLAQARARLQTYLAWLPEEWGWTEPFFRPAWSVMSWVSSSSPSNRLSQTASDTTYRPGSLTKS